MQTESAKEARKAFYCELCAKGYGRINDFEAHESSYDHLHKKVRSLFSTFVVLMVAVFGIEFWAQDWNKEMVRGTISINRWLLPSIALWGFLKYTFLPTAHSPLHLCHSLILHSQFPLPSLDWKATNDLSSASKKWNSSPKTQRPAPAPSRPKLAPMKSLGRRWVRLLLNLSVSCAFALPPFHFLLPYPRFGLSLGSTSKGSILGRWRGEEVDGKNWCYSALSCRIYSLMLPSTDTGGPDSKGGFKKGGFKNAFAPAETTAPPMAQQQEARNPEKGAVKIKEEEVRVEQEEGESESDDGQGEGGEKYDPRRPTGCWDGCPGRHVVVAWAVSGMVCLVKWVVGSGLLLRLSRDCLWGSHTVAVDALYVRCGRN